MKYQIIISTILLILQSLSAYGQVLLEPACAESIQRYGVRGSGGSQFYWYFDHSYGRIIDGEGTDTVTIQWFYKTGRVEMEVLEINHDGCAGIPTQAIVNIVAPAVDLGLDFPEICQGDTFWLSAGSNYVQPYSLLWNDSYNSENFYSTQSGEIWLKVTDGRGCTRSDTVSLLVHSLPVLNLTEDTIFCNERETYFLEAGDMYATYQWTSTSGNTSSNPYIMVFPAVRTTDTVYLTVTDFNGCQASDYTTIIPCNVADLFLDMPNTITPDGDGRNDVWNIPYMDLFPVAELEIFDRWGRLVFRTKNVAGEPWNGKSDGRNLPMDSYYYVLHLNAFGAKPIAGTINLVR